MLITPIRAAVLTISDRRSAGSAPDTAGPAVERLIVEILQADIVHTEIIPDEQDQIEARLRELCDRDLNPPPAGTLGASGVAAPDLILTVGGTGFAPRDVTPEAVRAVVERLTPGLDEAMRAASAAVTPHAMLSRAISGIRGRTLIVSLPGSEKAAVQNLQAILKPLRHGLEKLRGDPGDCG